MSNDVHDLAAGRAKIITDYGKWTDHNILLDGDVYTMDKNIASEKLRRIVQVVADITNRPLSDLRILDLACLEGQYAIEFARHGARSVAIEGRTNNIEKARFVKNALNLQNLEIVQDDIRHLSIERYGKFDVVLCLGILYHLDAPDVFEMIERIGSVCSRAAVFDTFVSLTLEKSYTYKGKTYWGRDMQEHDPEADVEERLADPWASLDNLKSVWITRNTLLNMLISTGFTSAYECWVPVELKKPLDRITMVAVKGSRQPILSTPQLNESFPELPEPFMPPVSPRQHRFAETKKRVSLLFPRRLRRAMKSTLRSVGLMDRNLDVWEARLLNKQHKSKDPDGV